MDKQDFENWLAQYGQAWENRDAEAVIELFTPHAMYYMMPFGEPKQGTEGIAEYWREATSTQDDIHFDSEVLAVVGNRGIARWWCSLRRLKTGQRVKFEGIVQVDFDEAGLGGELREWYHSAGVPEG